MRNHTTSAYFNKIEGGLVRPVRTQLGFWAGLVSDDLVGDCFFNQSDLSVAIRPHIYQMHRRHLPPFQPEAKAKSSVLSMAGRSSARKRDEAREEEPATFLWLAPRR
jgi:hypothetical protein